MNEHVQKYCPPTKFDTLPYGTLWSVMDEDKVIGRYIQLSKEESSPNWQIWGSFLESCFMNQIDNKEFMVLLLESYEKKDSSFPFF